jgi:hypothetical protein
MMNTHVARTELVWPGKYDDHGNRVEPPRVMLPFQLLERLMTNTNETTPIPEPIYLEQQRLQRQIRWLTFGLAVTLTLLLLGEASRWVSSTQGAAGEVRARRVILTDEQGRVRAELGLVPGGQEPELVFYHPDGQQWAALAMVSPPGAPEGRSQAALTLRDEAGEARISLGASVQETGLVLYDAEGAPGLALYTSEDAQGLVISGGGAPRVLLRYSHHDEAHLSELVLRDEQKRTLATLRGGSGGASLQLYRPDGEQAFHAP